MGITPLPLILLGQGGGTIIAEIPVGFVVQDGPTSELTFIFLVISRATPIGFCKNIFESGRFVISIITS